jgi:hypothetical protein
MDDVERLEARLGMSLPTGYRVWTSKKYTDFHAGHNNLYLWVHEAEWIPLEEMFDLDLGRDLGRTGVLPGLIPFAFTGAGDRWCWNSNFSTAEGEYEIWLCLHDEELGENYAPTFAAWFYRTCLEHASDVERNEGQIQEARDYLRLWSARLSEFQPGAWAEHLAALAEASPFEYIPENRRARHKPFGLITSVDVAKIVTEEFGPQYLGGKVAWCSW